jgi:hypothetical protein
VTDTNVQDLFAPLISLHIFFMASPNDHRSSLMEEVNCLLHGLISANATGGSEAALQYGDKFKIRFEVRTYILMSCIHLVLTVLLSQILKAVSSTISIEHNDEDTITNDTPPALEDLNTDVLLDSDGEEIPDLQDSSDSDEE